MERELIQLKTVRTTTTTLLKDSLNVKHVLQDTNALTVMELSTQSSALEDITAHYTMVLKIPK